MSLKHKVAMSTVLATAVFASVLPLTSFAAYTGVKISPTIKFNDYSAGYFKVRTQDQANATGTKGANEQVYISLELYRDDEYYDSDVDLSGSNSYVNGNVLSGELDPSDVDDEYAVWYGASYAAIWNSKTQNYTYEKYKETDYIFHGDNGLRKAAVSNQKQQNFDESAEVFGIDQANYDVYKTGEFLAENTGLSVDENAKFRVTMNELLYQGGEIKKGDHAPGIFLNEDKDEIIVVFKSKDDAHHKYTFQKEEDNNWELVDKEEATE
ncbi:hypothetical protein [Brevibacillus nitrificans]|uniref:hypothetical protein n=1 Tax=Brevibacillus nitrificans TaxID=651560 RepID=UPI00285D8BD7|nr:hypothetical protein [Brevibacillus nitrificans]MDR7317175.1 hypothetical protein [Brevibacillus nitrificans]